MWKETAQPFGGKYLGELMEYWREKEMNPIIQLTTGDYIDVSKLVCVGKIEQTEIELMVLVPLFFQLMKEPVIIDVEGVPDECAGITAKQQAQIVRVSIITAWEKWKEQEK